MSMLPADIHRRLELLRPDPEKTPRYITHTTERSVGGAFFAVHVWWNPEMGGFWEPWETGVGRYRRMEDAADEARAWAIDKGLPYFPGLA